MSLKRCGDGFSSSGLIRETLRRFQRFFFVVFFSTLGLKGVGPQCGISYLKSSLIQTLAIAWARGLSQQKFRAHRADGLGLEVFFI